MTPAEVLAAALARPAPGGVRVVGVDGPSGSGKSTLARALAEVSGAPLVECDDFVSWHDFAGWWSRFDADVLTPLLDGRDATYRVHDWVNDEYRDLWLRWMLAEERFFAADGTRERADVRIRTA